MKFIFLGPVLIFSALIAYEIRKNTRKDKAASDAFWDKEEEANSTRNKDISGLNYIKVPLEQLPLGLLPAFDELVGVEKKIKELADKPVYSLKGRTNTEVKLEFGVGNFEYLCSCDENFISLLLALSKEAELLNSMGFETEARQVLEYSLSIGDDIPKDYITLAEIYKNQKDSKALQNLIQRAKLLDTPTSKVLTEKLEEIAD